MNDELNDVPNELEDTVLESDVSEIKMINDNEIVLEEVSESNSTKTKYKPQKNNNSSLISKISTTFIVGGLAATTVLLPAVSTNDVNLSIELYDAYVTDTSIECGVYVDDPSLTTLTFIVSNKFTNRTFPIETEENSFLVENLASNMEYEITVVMPSSFGQNKVLASMSVKTLSEEDYRTARFNGVKTECRCNIDNKFYFTMDYVDNLGVYMEFYAYLEDEHGNVDVCYFNYDLHSEQSIVLETIDIESKVRFVILGYVIDGDDSKEVEFYNAEVAV